MRYSYLQLSTDDEILSKNESSSHLIIRHKSRPFLGALIRLSVILSTLLIGFGLGMTASWPRTLQDETPGTVPRSTRFSSALKVRTSADSIVSIGNSIQVFAYNDSFAVPPKESSGVELVWDSLLPSTSIFLSMMDGQV